MLNLSNINEAEEGRRLVELAEDKERQRGRTPETCQFLYRSLKATLSYFTVKLVIITKEFAILIEVSRLSCDDLVMIL